MQDVQTYRRYAADCMNLARSMPEHRDSLHRMAATWTALAEAAEKKARNAEGAGEAKPK
jgi:hypothetical protein